MASRGFHSAKAWFIVMIFIVGMALGIFGIMKWEDVIAPYIPSFTSINASPVKGIVVAKQKKDGELLLTVNTHEGALLATFKKKIDEINLLVSEGDEIEFSLGSYKPFIVDPAIHRVRKDNTFSRIVPDEKPDVRPGKEQEKESVELPSSETPITEPATQPLMKPAPAPESESEIIKEEPKTGPPSIPEPPSLEK